MPKSLVIRKHFLDACQIRLCRNKWYGDNAWMDILTEHCNLTTITKRQLNSTLPDIVLEDPLKPHYSRQAMRLEEGTHKKAVFYFIEDNNCTRRQLQHPKSWVDTYHNYVLPRIPRKRPRLDCSTSERDEIDVCDENVEGRIGTRNNGNEIIEFPPLNEDIAKNIGDWWDSPEARKLYAPTSLGDVKIELNILIDLLEEFIHNPRRMEGGEIDDSKATKIIHKSIILRLAYVLALEHRPAKTWEWCCKEAIKKAESMGIRTINDQEECESSQ